MASSLGGEYARFTNTSTSVGDSTLINLQMSYSGGYRMNALIGAVVTNVGSGSYSNALTFSTSNAGTATEKLRISGEGNVGIGNTSPSYKLHVTGDVNATGCVRASGSVLGGTCSSDERLKTDIQSFELGVIAQDVDKSAPELIATSEVELHPDDANATEIK